MPYNDRRALSSQTVGEVLELARRGMHAGEEAAAADEGVYGPSNPEKRVRANAGLVDEILMDPSSSPAFKFQSVCTILGYLARAHGPDAWCRLHIPLVIEHRG